VSAGKDNLKEVVRNLETFAAERAASGQIPGPMGKPVAGPAPRRHSSAHATGPGSTRWWFGCLLGVLAIVLAACNALARIYLGAHNPLDVVGGAAIGLMIAAVLDLILDVARVLPQLDAPAREDRAT
jgi:PAP2 superfamily